MSIKIFSKLTYFLGDVWKLITANISGKIIKTALNKNKYIKIKIPW